MKHCVYYIYNIDNEIIYIGCSKNTLSRVYSHLQKNWGDEISKVELNWFDTRKDALSSESNAIFKIKPKYNIQCNPDKKYTSNKQENLIKAEKWLTYEWKDFFYDGNISRIALKKLVEDGIAESHPQDYVGYKRRFRRKAIEVWEEAGKLGK